MFLGIQVLMLALVLCNAHNSSTFTTNLDKNTNVTEQISDLQYYDDYGSGDYDDDEDIGDLTTLTSKIAEIITETLVTHTEVPQRSKDIDDNENITISSQVYTASSDHNFTTNQTSTSANIDSTTIQDQDNGTDWQIAGAINEHLFDYDDEDLLDIDETELTTQSNEFNVTQQVSQEKEVNNSDLYLNKNDIKARANHLLNSSNENNQDKQNGDDFTFNFEDNSKETTDKQTQIEGYNEIVGSRRRTLFNIDLNAFVNYTSSSPDYESTETTIFDYDYATEGSNQTTTRPQVDTDYNNATTESIQNFTNEEDGPTTLELIQLEGKETLPTNIYNEETLPRCPKGLRYKRIDSLSLCYLITEPTTFPPRCPYPNNILQHSNYHGFDYNCMSDITNQTVWAFAKRDASNEFGQFKFLNASSDAVQSYNPAVKDITKANCLIVSNSEFTAVHCDAKHPAACVYDFNYLSFDDYCRTRYNSTCFAGDLNSGNICYCRIESHEKLARNSFCQKLAEPKQPYQNNLLARYLYNPESCWIGIHKGRNSNYEWSSMNTSIDYTYWASDTDFSKPYGVITEQGWTLMDDKSVNCAICQVDVEEHPEIELRLRYIKSNSTVELKIVNGIEIYGGRIFCFGNNFTTNIAFSTTDKSSKYLTRSYSTEIPYHYWCTALKVSDFTPVYSNKIYINPTGNTKTRRYLINVFYPEHGDPHLSSSDSKACEAVENLNPKLFTNAEPIKIKNYNEELGQIEVICSLTATSTELSIKEEYQQITDSLQNASYRTENLVGGEVCLSSTTTSTTETLLHWPETQIGVTATPDEICLQENGLPVTRTCLGNFIYGGFWSEVNGTCANLTLSTRTTSLDKLLRSRDVTPSILSRTLLNVTKDDFNVTSFQIHLMSRVFKRISSKAQPRDIESIVGIANNLMHFERKRLRVAQNLLNSTDEILYGLDESLIQTKTMDRHREIAIVTEKVLVQELNLQNTNLRGIKISKSNESRGFVKQSLKFLDQQVSEDQLIENDLEAAVIISEELQGHMRNCPGFSDMPTVIATIFYDDTLFNERENSSRRRSEGKIVSLLAPNFTCDFGAPLKVLFKSSSNETRLKCASWTYGFDLLQENIHGHWSIESDPKAIQNSTYQLCEFYHITHFSLLVLGETENSIDEVHKQALDIITAIGSGLSVLGLLIIFVTAIIFKSFRSANGIAINFSIAMTAQVVLLFLADNLTEDDVLCTVLGALLHYIVLAQFFWMLTIAVLQYYRYVLIVSNLPSYVILKSCAFAWGIPLIPVIVIVSVSTENYARNSYGLCYAVGNYFIFGLLVPVSVIVFLNLLIFLRILLSIASSRRKMRVHQKKDDTAILQLRLAVMLYFLLGLTWGFGLVAAIGGGIVYSYLFCLTATLQGFILFLYFIILNEKSRRLWTNMFSCKKKSPAYDYSSESATSTMMQRRARNTNTSDTSDSAAERRMLQKYKNRNSLDF